ncbi:MAG: NUDIX domain-containing protein [Sedimenticola sp.]
MKFRFEIVDSALAHDGFLGLKRFWLKHDLFAGGSSDVLVRECIVGLESAAVLLYDPNRDEVVMIEQFRIGALEDPQGAWLLEIVGGLVEEGQHPDEVARRESLEEAGCEIKQLLPICEFMVSPGYSSERTHLFCGLVDASSAGGVHGLAEEGEDIRVEVLPAEEAIAELYGGRVNSTTAIITMQWLAMNRMELMA